MSYDFKPWPKIPRLSKMACSITEKLDGTNAIIHIAPYNPEVHVPSEGVAMVNGWVIYAGSRTRWIRPSDDNFGFAAWVEVNADALVRELGEGTHYGEWWGQGIQRTYGLTKKYFTLFSPWRYGWGKNPAIPTAREQIMRDTLLGVVPILSQEHFSPSLVGEAELMLKEQGSMAVPGYMNAEGLVVHIGGDSYKVVINGENGKRSGA